MTQQVLRARVRFPSLGQYTDNSSFDLILEATGSNTAISFSLGNPPLTIINHFLNGTEPGQGNPLCVYTSSVLSRVGGAVTIDYTDITAHLNGSAAGPPFFQEVITLGAALASEDLPAECAVVCSYRGDYGPLLEHGDLESVFSTDSAIDQGAPATHPAISRPRSRVRGRFFYPPVNTLVLAAADGVIATSPHTDFSLALRGLLQTQNSGAASQYNVVQWSRANAAVTLPTFFNVGFGIGSQRRRTDTTLTRVHAWTPRV